MRVPEVSLTLANLTPAPQPVDLTPLQAPIPVTPPPQVGSDLLHLSSQAANLNAQLATDPAAQRQLLVGGLLQALAGDHPLPPELSLTTTSLAPATTPAAGQAPTPGQLAAQSPANLAAQGGLLNATASGAAMAAANVTASAAAQAAAAEALSLSFPALVVTADGGRLAVRVALTLQPGMIQYAPHLVEAMAESVIGRNGALPVIQLPQLPTAQALGFQLMISPASMWPLTVAIATGVLRLRRPDEPEHEEERAAEEEHAAHPSVGDSVRNWLELHRQRATRDRSGLGL